MAGMEDCGRGIGRRVRGVKGGGVGVRLVSGGAGGCECWDDGGEMDALDALDSRGETGDAVSATEFVGRGDGARVLIVMRVCGFSMGLTCICACPCGLTASKLNGLRSSVVGGSGDISCFSVGEGVISGVIVSNFTLPGIGGAGL